MPRPHAATPKSCAVLANSAATCPPPAERKLWAALRNDQLGVNFSRQHAIGNTIPDCDGALRTIRAALGLELEP